MTIIRRIAQGVLDLNKFQSEFALDVYSRVGLYRRIYEACGLSKAAAIDLEKNMLAAVPQGIADQHQLLSRWVQGETDFRTMTAEYGRWIEAYVTTCGSIAAEASAHAD